jgi:hypothetical protein
MPIYLLVSSRSAKSVMQVQSECIDVVPLEDPLQGRRIGRIHSPTITAMAAAMTRFSRQPPKGMGPLLDRDALQAEFQQMLMSALVASE